MAVMWELSIDIILVVGNSEDEEEKEEDDEGGEEHGKYKDIEKRKIPPSHHPTFCTTRTNTNPFISKWGKV